MRWFGKRQDFAAAGALTFEIFATGEWHGKTYKASDLEQIAKNFADLKGLHQVPLKLGHSDAQKWFGQEDGAPALGWVDKVYVSGDRLMADATGIPDAVMQLIKDNRYKRCSVELYYDVPVDGKNVGTVLGAVALLGADLPAVNVLQDLTSYLHGLNAGAVRRMQFTGTPQTFTRDNPEYQPEEEPSMTREEQDALEKRIRDSLSQDFSRQLADKDKLILEKDRELEKHNLSQKDALARLKAEKFVVAKRRVLDVAKKLVDKFALTPALYDALDVEVEAQREKFSAEDGKLVFGEDVISKLLAAVEKGELGVKRTGKPVRQNHATGQVMEPTKDDQDLAAAEVELRQKVDERVISLRAANPQGKNLFNLAHQQVVKEYPELALKARINVVSFGREEALEQELN